MAARVKELSKTFVWILMGLLVAGLAGFGATNLTGTAHTVATVGDQTVSTEAYARELQREIRAVEAQGGQALQMSQVKAMGLDQQVLGQLVALASLDNEVDQLGISIGDEALQKEILAIPAFHGPDGKFDRDTYRFQLDQAGLNDVDFETDLRHEAARTLVQSAIVGGVKMPQAMTDALVDYIGARRSFSFATLTADALSDPLPAPDEAGLKAYYEAHGDQFTLPETKSITYALLTPEMILDQVDVDEASIRRLYDERQADYNTPERRLVERLVFPDEQAAKDAMAQIEVGGTTFEQLVDQRGLAMSDVDMGDLGRDDLGQAADAVFAANVDDVVGPLPSNLGPALYRVNGVLAAQATPYEEARDELRDELASERARRLIEAQAEDINDRLAGGATLKELADETDMELGTIDWTTESSDGVAAYDAFRAAASKVTADDFPEVKFLEDGGLFALQLDKLLPPRPEPFEDARDRVVEGWTAEATRTALAAQAQSIVDGLGDTGDLAGAGLTVRQEVGLTRTAFLEDSSPDLMTQVFTMAPGEIRIIPGDQMVQIVRLNEVLPPEETPDLDAMRKGIAQQIDQSLAQQIFNAYARDAQLRAHPTVDQRALNAAQANFQ
ncbi:peptidyl-prolyl cis-trans isomerase [Pseudodonghicola xiamenensis]|uniref:Parvulin-like PPIase n=1 Tax=Pseudodonghicola xiamenensis TaxID=337702 RepID=A0A8J3H524_9RHOB|nr:peptidyl-prolyl cis-trans isomerase [Pseudodonghicola xiamenensis]GHG87703.1 peptidyl-prolyl cis-trans isomerase [Pseudodonghicola xiamenensis]